MLASIPLLLTDNETDISVRRNVPGDAANLLRSLSKACRFPVISYGYYGGKIN
jgi:hypothetical protein